MENNKKYVGSGKQTHEAFINIAIEVTNQDFKEAIYEYNGKKYVKLTVGKKREADQYGKTHYVCIDEYKPEEEGSQLPF